ncbi:hypothetical protein ACFY1J_05550 [Streptomyces sp. NPDC001406]|uniref:hypothetical protein n=1 Tax=Streptomyces sp. NPDC001406 TaxID=3364572 RepID=UPI0036A28A37
MQTATLFDLPAVQTPQETPAGTAPAKAKRKKRAVHPSVPLKPSTTVPDELIRDADWVVVSSSGARPHTPRFSCVLHQDATALNVGAH